MVTRLGLMVGLALATGIAGAGEPVFQGGQRPDAELATPMLLVSTGSPRARTWSR